MGLYPQDYYKRNADSGLLIHTRDGMDGLVTTTYYQPILVIEERTNCFCCTCSGQEGDDPACRNHGWAATRPCDIHGMPGSPWEDTDDMPEAVSIVRAADRRNDDEGSRRRL